MDDKLDKIKDDVTDLELEAEELVAQAIRGLKW